VEIARKNNRYLFACDTGTGKTRLGYEIFKDKNLPVMLIKDEKKFRNAVWVPGEFIPADSLDIVETIRPELKCLVLCPMPIIEDAWLKQAKEWVPDLTVVNGRHRKKKHFPKNWDIMILNYETITAMYKKTHPKVRGSTASQRRDLLEQWDEWRGQFDMIILDESVKIKGFTSKVYESVNSLCEDTSYVYLMSGCPAPNGPLEYYNQQKLVHNPHFDKWATWRVFRMQFYYQPRQEHTWLWEPLFEDSEEQIIELCKEKTVFIQKEDCLDLPPQIYETRTVTMAKKEKEAYNEMKREFILQLTENPGDAVVAQNVLSQVMKLRQMTAGFVANEMGWHEIGTTKLNALKEILDEIGDKQVLIFGQFRREIERIVSTLGDKAEKLYGGMSESDRRQSVDRFMSGECQYLVAHPATAKYGFTFTNASYCIWTSISDNFDEWYQGNQRIHRYGQDVSTTHIALLAEDSIDQRIYNNSLMRKGDLNKSLLEMLK
jgi:SNF2 family DNA or RNA helicase